MLQKGEEFDVVDRKFSRQSHYSGPPEGRWAAVIMALSKVRSESSLIS